jgi:uncharacterized protein HemY
LQIRRTNTSAKLGALETANAQRHCTILQGLAFMRTKNGQYQEAIDRLQAGIATREGKTGGPHDWLVLAMAHHRLGHEAEARQWLDRAVQELDKESTLPVDSDAGTARATARTARSWTDRLELDSFRREAESLLKQKNN